MWEVSVAEQAFPAVLALIRDGAPVVEVAPVRRVSSAVHRWLRWYEDQGLAGFGR